MASTRLEGGTLFSRYTSTELSPAMFIEALSHTRNRRCKRSALQAQILLDLCSHRALTLPGQGYTVSSHSKDRGVCSDFQGMYLQP